MWLIPFELVFRHEVRGPLKLLKDHLLQPEPDGTMLQYVSELKDQFWAACEVARDNLYKAQGRIKPITIGRLWTVVCRSQIKRRGGDYWVPSGEYIGFQDTS